VPVDLVVQHAKRMSFIILPYVACLVLPDFSTLSHKRHAFRNKVLNMRRVFLFSLQRLSETFIILKRIQHKCCHRSVLSFHVIYPLLL
jgi:hypothetical protein